MTHEQFKSLDRGDLVLHKGWKGRVAIVTGNYGDHVIAVMTFDLSNPIEWDLLFKANYSREQEPSALPMSDKIIIPGLYGVAGIALNKACPDSNKGLGIFELEIESAGQVSDGYHTFDELYEHRHLLFCMVSQTWIAAPAWKSKTHWIDGKLEPCWDGWFLAGMDIRSNPQDENRMISYHLPLAYWDLFCGIELKDAPVHDGHTSKDVILRLKEFLSS